MWTVARSEGQTLECPQARARGRAADHRHQGPVRRYLHDRIQETDIAARTSRIWADGWSKICAASAKSSCRPATRIAQVHSPIGLTRISTNDGPGDNARHECAVGIDAARRDPKVVAFVATLADPLVSAAVFHELGYGVELLPEGTRKARLSVGSQVSKRISRIGRSRSTSRLRDSPGDSARRPNFAAASSTPLDSLIAASAMSRSARLATRNTRHFNDLALNLVNPCGLTAFDRRAKLVVNGEPREIAAANLAEALDALDYADAIVATALNGEFVPARKREAAALNEGDRIEIVAPRQGG